jgi:cobalt/nickel transport system ATP-binding protein
MLLEANDLTVRYNRDDAAPAIDGVSFTLDAGERLALTGNNGAGKSTLLLALAGALRPERGGFKINGEDGLSGKTGLVMQNPDNQLFMPTVYDDIAFGLRNAGFSEDEIAHKVDAIAEQLGISELKTKMSRRLSGGEKRLAALAGILVLSPALLLLDEPATFLDPPGRERLIAILAPLSEAMIIATHDADFAGRLCTRTVRLEKGRMA